jgi:glutamate formiminotransferase
MTPPILLAVPNVSEGRDEGVIAELTAALAPEEPGTRLLDVHSDRSHHRTVLTLAGRQGALADALVRVARVAVDRIDVVSRSAGDPAGAGAHPHVGAIDVVPVVYLDATARGAACAAALVVGERIGSELGVPVFLYGELAGDRPGRTRAQLRRGGVVGLGERMAAAASSPGAVGVSEADFGPPALHPSAGATLVAAREPLVAFNVELAAPATVADARRVAALIREGGEQGLPGVRAIGVELDGGIAQVSINVERPLALPLAEIVQAVARHARPASAELVGLAPRAALEGFPEDLPMPGFDPSRHVIENALGS